jgi:hypothetical protein
MWQFNVKVQNVSEPIGDVKLQIVTSNAAGATTYPVVDVVLSPQFTVAEDVRSITLMFTHARYASLALILERDASETQWRWTNAPQNVVTSGKDVTVTATLCRARYAPTKFYRSEDNIAREAREAKEPKDLDAKQKKADPPKFVKMKVLDGAMVERNGIAYRMSVAASISAFHILNADPLGDPKEDGYGRFSTTTKRNVAPAAMSRVHLFEYGEVGTAPEKEPLMLVGVWLPNVLTDVGYYPKLDVLVWFTPNTTAIRYPDVQYPFRGDYPYALVAEGGISRDPITKVYSSPQPYVGIQRYVNLPFGHYFSAGHYLAHQMIAAGRAVAIIVPVAPSSHFELWESPGTLMRMLKELCLSIPTSDNDRIAKLHSKPRELGRVGVAGFSSAGPRLHTLLTNTFQNNARSKPYDKDVWGTEADAKDFKKALAELWCIDGNFGAEHQDFLEKVAKWVGDSKDRKARIYKNDFTDGRWDPRNERAGEFGKWVRTATVQQRDAGTNWAVSCADAVRRMQVVSVSKSYMVNPNSKEEPLLPNVPNATHENMPRVFFGHAAVTSGFQTLR